MSFKVCCSSYLAPKDRIQRWIDHDEKRALWSYSWCESDQSRDSLMQARKISSKSVQVAEDGQTPAHHIGLSLLEVAMLQDMLFERLSKMGIMAMVLLTVAEEVMVFMPSKTYGIRSLRDGGRRCREIYVAKERETLQSISVRCDAPFILIDNPHIQDMDDVSPGLVLTFRSPQS